jgi:flagellar basal body-associated protein FliL
MAEKNEDKKQTGVKDKLMLYITLGVLGFVALVIGGEYVVILYSQSKTDEVVEAQPEVIALSPKCPCGSNWNHRRLLRC